MGLGICLAVIAYILILILNILEKIYKEIKTTRDYFVIMKHPHSDKYRFSPMKFDIDGRWH